MPATLTQTEAPAAGTTVKARPWVAGVEQLPAKGVVVVPQFTADQMLVWFPAMGPLRDEQAGKAYQPIYVSKAEVTGTVADWSAARLREVHRGLHQSDLPGGETYPLFKAITLAKAAKRA